MNSLFSRWRPSLALVVTAVCCTVLILPLAAVLFLKLGVNRFIHETEQSLIQQASIYAGIYATAFEAATRARGGAKMPGYYLPPQKRVFWNARARTFAPLLNLQRDQILPARPEPVAVSTSLGDRHKAVARTLETVSSRSGRTTLSNVVFLDHTGVDLHASEAAGFAEVSEVQKALTGGIGAALRWREETQDAATYLSLSRGTGFRVFIAFPVISENRVIGAVYLSRTPDELVAYLSGERTTILVLAGITICGTLALGALLSRLVTGPIKGLREQARAIAAGNLEDLTTLKRYGVHELAQLGEAVIAMARRLSARSKEINIYTTHVTHELKTPITAIISASELLQDDTLDERAQGELLATLNMQGRRMDHLLNRLREVTRLRQQGPGRPTFLEEMLPAEPSLQVIARSNGTPLPLSTRHGETVLVQMAQNAVCHGAKHIWIEWDGKVLHVSDDGEGFADKDTDRLTEPFFTSRRDRGGTGLGLSIVDAILQLYDARFVPINAQGGAKFRIEFPQSR
ncbi:ATP-binding protein [uncultured Roseibium sp.]|uniref:ATP-binding protein n=1 Tax=uncultured Roseibium sp. TaxID=1936171 RepID=UPI00261D145E|nr:ATP-binding protein [uncultured Roseibium sp.]